MTPETGGKPRLPRLDTTMESRTEEPMSERLVAAIAKTLELERGGIHLHDSFSELGGDDDLADELVTSCSSLGLTLTTDDILRCRTIAELQTCLRPSADAPRPQTESDDGSSRISDTFSMEPKRSSNASDSSNSPTRASCDRKRSVAPEDLAITEHLLASTSQVPRATLIRPKAGYFEGKLVAFLTLVDISAADDSNPDEITLIPQLHHQYAGSQVAALRYLLEESSAITAVPTAWIILEKMPLTPSGVCDRRRLQTWIQNMNEDLYQQIMSVESQELLQEPSTDMERSLQRLISAVLKTSIDRIGMNFSFKQLGGDEFSALQLVAACKFKGILVTTDDIALSDSIAHLAFLASYKANAPSQWEQDCGTGDFGLSPMQQLYFRTDVGGDHEARANNPWEYRFHQSMLLKIKGEISLDDIQAAIEAVVGHHSMLRARFRTVNGTWRQSTLSDISTSYSFGRHIVKATDQVLGIIQQSQASIDIQSGPVFAAELIRTTDDQQMLFLVAHHLVVDLISWRVVVHDLNELLQNGSLYSERSMPFQKWNELQEEEIKSLEHSFTLSFGITPGDFSFWGLDPSRNTYGDVEEVSFALAPELSYILHSTCNDAFRTDSTDIYLSTLLLSFCQTFPERAPPVIWNQEHGREPWDPEVDIAETVGWFTTLCPLWMDTDSTEDLISVLCRLKDTRRAVPHRGWAYFASRFLGPDAEKFASHDWPFEIMFTYGGSLQQLEAENGILEQLPIPGRALGSATSDIGSRVGRVALFEVSTMVDQGVAKVKFLYNRESRHQDRIAAWVSNFEHLLLEAVGRLRYRTQELTLADVPLLNVGYDGVAKLNGERMLKLNIPSARDIENVYPVTPQQQEILISQSKSPESCHIHAIFEFSPGPKSSVDTSKLCTAWQQTVAKYPALRTVFIESVSDDGLFDQVILRKCSPAMLFIDAGPSEDAVTALNKLPALQCAPSEPHHRLSFCGTRRSTFLKLEISQAICDAISLDKISDDLKCAYACNNVTGRNLELSYPKYIQSLRDARMGSKVDFWRVHLRGCKPCLFPALWTPGEGRTLVTNFKVDVSVADLDAYARRMAVSRSTILRLAWGLVLKNYIGSKRVCFGYRHTGRDAPQAPLGIDSAVGAFESTVICSLDLSSQKPLEAALQAAEDQQSLYLPHQFTPVSEVQHALGLPGAGLFNTCLSYHDENRGLKSRFNDSRAQSRLDCVLYYNTVDQDISVSVMANAGALDVTLTHRILTSTQAENVANSLGCAVKAIISATNGSVGGVDLFSERDYAQLPPVAPLDESRRQLPVHELVDLIAKDDPDAPAVASWDGRLCYRQLSRLVAHLARYLVELGVEPGTPVPVLLGKSRWSSVAMLAVLKSGACFVPLDEEDTYFSRRIVGQLRSRIILATDITAGKRLDLKGEELVIVNELLFSAPLAGDKECPAVQMEDPACMVFRSPSAKNKEAKGIFFTHEALGAAFVAQGPALGINIASRVLQLSAFSSDTALSEILTTLVHGGCVCVPGSKERGNDLAGSIQRLEANWTYFTPVLARRLRPAAVPTIQTICFRTRRLDADTFARWTSKTRVLLSYGTSDICPLGISVTEVTAPDQLSRISPPFIGKFWVVNPEDHRRLMPVGAIGELAIESPTLAYKLMKDCSPIQTLFAQTRKGADGTKSRFFKTGHWVRYMNDGTLEFITSCRDEVTVNGNIIPVPTVEQHIRRCMGSASEVVVDSVTTKEGTSILTAFLELGHHFEGDENLASLSLVTRERAFIVKKLAESHFHTILPSYMLPAAFVPLKTFPMTSSLKIHRRKLQKMAGSLTESALLDIATVADPQSIKTPNIKPLPLTQVEEQMRGIWARLLNIDPKTITGTQSFFRLGGDAHLVGNLIIACRKEGLVIPLSAVLQNASLTELCQSITLAQEPVVPVVTAPVSPVEVSPVIKHVMTTVAPEAGIEAASVVDAALATTAQIRSLESALRASRAGVNHLVLNFSGSMDAKKVETACHQLVKTHPILSTLFVTHNRRVYQVVADTAPEYARVQTPSWRLATVIEKTLKKDQPCTVVMEKPITKFTFVDGGKQSALVIRMSTAQYDDSTLPLLLQDFKRIYTETYDSLYRPSFVDFARSAAKSNHLAIPHWSSLLQGASITHILSHTRPPRPTSTPRALTASVPAAPAITSELGITFDTVLKAAWSIVLANLSSTPDVTFGEVVDGRHVRVPSQGVSGVLGPLHNAIPVRVRFDVRGTPLELLRCVHEQRLASIPYETMGMYDLVEKCTPWPYWSRFSTVVQHRYREGLGVAARFGIGGAECTASVTESAFRDMPDLLVSSVQSTPEQASLSITFCEGRIPTSFVETVLHTLVSTIESLSSLHEAIIPGAEELSAAERQIPLPQVDIKSPTQPAQPDPAVREVIAKAWDELLDPRAHGVPEEHIPVASFYDLWGSLIPGHMLAVRLTSDLAHHDVTVTMEDVIDNPTQQKQLELVDRKMRHREKASGWKAKLLSSKERKPSCETLANGAEAPKGGGGVSPIAEDSDFVFSPMDDVVSPFSLADPASMDGAETPAEGKLRRRASKVIGRMSRLSFSQPKTAT